MLPAAQLSDLRRAAQPQRGVPRPAPATIDETFELVQHVLPEVELVLSAALSGPSPVGDAAAGLVTAGGKRVRPIATLLSTAVCEGDLHQALGLAAAVELTHSATLLHDDVLDEGEMRRGMPAARVTWGNLVSVLGGDLLLTSALKLVDDSGLPGVMTDFIGTLHQLVGGEVAQFNARGNDRLGRDGYLEIVRGKTGSLFGFACRAGARVAGAPDAWVRALGAFGEHAGVAFQVVDDALDFDGSPTELGKRLGADLLEGKTTLPLAIALQKDRAQLAPLLARVRDGDDDAASRLAQSTALHEGCAEARSFAQAETQRGLERLAELPQSRARDAFEALVRELIWRRA